MTDSVVIPLRLRLITDNGGDYELTAGQFVFSANGLNVAVVDLAVGRHENGGVTSVSIKRGDAARIEVSNANITSSTNPLGLVSSNQNNYLYLASSQFVLFRGVVDDFGPGNLSTGQFVLQVRVVGQLMWLAQGTLSSSNILANNFWDTNVQSPVGQGKKDPVLIDMTVAQANFWTGLQQALQRVATLQLPVDAPKNSVAAVISRVFGASANVRANALLGAILGPLMTWNTGRTTGEIGAIIFNLNQYLQSEWMYEPFLNRIITMGEMLQFAIIENGLGIQVVPYVPFFRRTDAYPLGPNTYAALNQPLASYKNFAGVVLVDGGGRDPGPSTVGAAPLGLYKMRGAPFGQVQVTQFPDYLGRLTVDTMTGGKGVRSFTADVPPELNSSAAILGNLLAKYNCWELNYGHRHLQVTCPMFRTDVGPLTAVRVDFPTTAEIAIALETPAVYGSVQSVTIQVDSTKGFAQTVYDIGFVRSFTQQKNQIDPDIEDPNEHPFFNTNYIGGRLDSLKRRSPSVV